MWTYDDNVVVPVYRKDDCKSKLLILTICSLYCSQARAEYTFEQLKELSLPETYSSVEWKTYSITTMKKCHKQRK